MQLIDNQDRSKLCEGRTSGIGFAFCRVLPVSIETIMPVSPCKDYLNDVVYSEHTGKPFQAYGLSTKQEGIFKSGCACIVMGIMPYNRQTTHLANHDDLEKALMAPETTIAAFLSHFEGKMGISPTTFEKVAENRMAAILSLDWVEFTYMVSLWSLLVRIGLKYKGGDHMEFLKAVNDNDAYLVKSALPKIERLLAGERPKQDLAALKGVHDCGICGFAFPAIQTNPSQCSPSQITTAS